MLAQEQVVIDDHTRQATAIAVGQKLTRHPDAVHEIEAQFQERAYPNRILMADLPSDAHIIPNPCNRIPGFTVGTIHCLPGFPKMAWPMMEWVLDTLYSDIPRKKIIQHTIIVYDIFESELVGLLAQFQQEHSNVKVSSLPSSDSAVRQYIVLGLRGEQSAVDIAKIMS